MVQKALVLKKMLLYRDRTDAMRQLGIDPFALELLAR